MNRNYYINDLEQRKLLTEALVSESIFLSGCVFLDKFMEELKTLDDEIEQYDCYQFSIKIIDVMNKQQLEKEKNKEVVNLDEIDLDLDLEIA